MKGGSLAPRISIDIYAKLGRKSHVASRPLHTQGDPLCW